VNGEHHLTSHHSRCLPRGRQHNIRSRCVYNPGSYVHSLSFGKYITRCTCACSGAGPRLANIVQLLSSWPSWLCHVYALRAQRGRRCQNRTWIRWRIPADNSSDAGTSPVVQRKKVLHEEVANRERSVSEVVVLLGKVATITRIIGPLPTPE